MTTVGIIGLGAMGSAMAGALVTAGHRPIGYDLQAAAVARFASEGGQTARDAAEVAATADLIVLVLRDEGQIDALLDMKDRAVVAFRPGAVVWVASTVSPAYVSRLGNRLALAEVRVLDGPVSGGVARARAGKLTLILAGDEIAYSVASEFAPALAERVFRVGNTPGAASVIKAANQLLTASHIALTAEALGFAIRAGVDPRTFLEVINVSAGASRMFADRAPRMLDADLTPHATIGIFLKDLSIALDTARLHGARIPMAAAAREVFREAADAFGGDLGDPAIFGLYPREAEEQF